MLGLLDLYQSTFNESYLSWAVDLQDQQIKLFYDEQNGGFFNVGEDIKNILIRLKECKSNNFFTLYYYLYKIIYYISIYYLDHDAAEPSA